MAFEPSQGQTHTEATPATAPSESARPPAPSAAPRLRTLRRVLAWLVSAGVVTALVVFGVRYTNARRPPPVQYQTATVDRGRVAAKVTASGTVSALVTVLVGSQVSGRIESLHADFNSVVKKGQVIAKIEASLFQASVEQARANVAAARANLEKAKAQSLDGERQYVRAKNLAEQGLIGKADLDTAEATALVSRAQVVSAEASVAQTAAALHQADVSLHYTTIVSPIDGVVISRNVDVGQTVAASLQAPTLFTIAQDLTKMQVDTNVAEADVGKIRADMDVTFTVDAYPTETFRGTVRQVRDAAQTIQNVVTYDAVIDVDNTRRLLKPSMTANVTFVFAEKGDVLRVPNAALRFRPEPSVLALVSAPKAKPPAPKPGQKVVWVQRSGAVSTLLVDVGISDGTLTEVVSGDLREGDRVIVEAVATGSSRPGS